VIVARLTTSSLFDSADRLVRFDHEG